MDEAVQLVPIDTWLAEVRGHVIHEAPDLLSPFDLYAAEAVHGRNFISPDLKHLCPGARVLEVGAGALLLSCQLVREGYQVTALEPIGVGFSHVGRIQQLVREKAAARGWLPRILKRAAEDLAEQDAYDYAFSVNVMEHVDDVERVVANVVKSLISGASYRFICPNYLFPYEPHFNIPTFFSKTLTERILGRKIFRAEIPDPVGTWNSLNWINVIQVRSMVKRLRGLKVVFNRDILVSTLERIEVDPHFAGRRSPAVRKCLSYLVRFGLHHLFGAVPVMFQPLMDCRLTKISASKVY